MAAEDVLRVYQAMDDDRSDRIRRAIAGRDFSVVDDSGLSAGERGLLTAAANEPYPEVTGLAAAGTGGPSFWAPARYATMEYLNAGLEDPMAVASFTQFKGRAIEVSP